MKPPCTTSIYIIGDLTMAKVFKPAGLTNVNDLQAVFDAVETALTPITTSKTTGHVTENDPNVTWGKKTISMTFMEWGYSATHTATVGGNCRALDNLSAALSQIYEGLFEDEFGTPYMILTNAAGDTLHVSDEDGQDNDWLLGMLVATSVINIEPEAGR